MEFSQQELIRGIQAGDLRAVARAITLIENQVPRIRAVQREIFRYTGNAHVIGVTGSPGAGKSTLVDKVARRYREHGKRVAVLAIDPTSPFSGGAILGDRIRMTNAEEREDIFIRSMATRGSLGGIAGATFDAIQVLDAAGFEIVLVETVGVGQAEVDVVRVADTCLVVLVPGMGDSVQAIKAGILEIADLFVINKSDRPEADSLHRDLRIMLGLAETTEGMWQPTIIKCVATEGVGVEQLIVGIENHATWMSESEKGKARKLQLTERTIIQIAASLSLTRIEECARTKVRELALQCLEKRVSPFDAALSLLVS